MNSYYDDLTLGLEDIHSTSYSSSELIPQSYSLSNYRPSMSESGTESLENSCAGQQMPQNCTKATKLFLRTTDNQNFTLLNVMMRVALRI